MEFNFAHFQKVDYVPLDNFKRLSAFAFISALTFALTSWNIPVRIHFWPICRRCSGRALIKLQRAFHNFQSMDYRRECPAWLFCRISCAQVWNDPRRHGSIRHSNPIPVSHKHLHGWHAPASSVRSHCNSPCHESYFSCDSLQCGASARLGAEVIASASFWGACGFIGR
jgi:hypothetical protein